MPDDRPVQTWELATMSQSLGMSSSFPASEARRLLSEVVRLRDGLGQIEAKLRELLDGPDPGD